MQIYLNNAATGFPKPDRVLRAVEKSLKRPPFHHARAGFAQEIDIVLECRKQLATLFNALTPKTIAFSSGATESLNLALRGLCLNGAHVVTTATEHNSVLRPLKTMERDGLITLSIAPCDNFGAVSVENICAVLKPETAVLVINHCSNVTGTVNDLKSIGEIARQNNTLFVVDAAQSAGVYPIDVQKMNIDILAFTGHKSLHGLQGIGGIYVREGVALTPLKVGGTGVRSDYLFQPESVPMRYEAGTLNLPGIISLYEGVNFIISVGLGNIRKSKEKKVRLLRQYLMENKKAVLYPNKQCMDNTSVFSFTIEGMDPEDIGYILENNFGIITRHGLHCAPLIHKYIGTFPQGTVRVSPSYFTTDKEIEGFGHAIEQILKTVN